MKQIKLKQIKKAHSKLKKWKVVMPFEKYYTSGTTHFSERNIEEDEFYRGVELYILRWEENGEEYMINLQDEGCELIIGETVGIKKIKQWTELGLNPIFFTEQIIEKQN